MAYRSSHYRRGHYRRTANGMVWVRPTTVSGHFYTPGSPTSYGFSRSSYSYAPLSRNQYYNSANQTLSGAPSSRTYVPTKEKAKIETYSQYLSELQDLYLRNGRRLTDQQINEFITENGLDVVFGITSSDVKLDLNTIEKRLNIDTSSGTTTSGRDSSCSTQGIQKKQKYFASLKEDKLIELVYVLKNILAVRITTNDSTLNEINGIKRNQKYDVWPEKKRCFNPQKEEKIIEFIRALKYILNEQAVEVISILNCILELKKNGGLEKQPKETQEVLLPVEKSEAGAIDSINSSNESDDGTINPYPDDLCTALDSVLMEEQVKNEGEFHHPKQEIPVTKVKEKMQNHSEKHDEIISKVRSETEPNQPTKFWQKIKQRLFGKR